MHEKLVLSLRFDFIDTIIMKKIIAKDIVEHLKNTNPKLSNIKGGQSTVLIREALKLLSEAIENANDDVVRVAGLGRFIIKTIERDKDGVKTTAKRVIFRAAKKKPDKT